MSRDRPVTSATKRVGIFVIAYNAESHVEKTLSRIPESVWQSVEVVYVVDDCSMDDTVQAALRFPRWRDKLVVLRNRVNRRYGGNQKFGYQYAIDRGLDAVVMLHADGQYAPEILPDMIGPIVDGEADVVIGSRMINRRDALRGGMPKYKYVGNIVLTKIENALAGMSLSEFHSGYRAYSTKFLGNIPFWENSDEWHFDTQILFQARESGARIKEFAIPTYYGDEICHVNGVVYGLNCIASAGMYALYRRKVVYSRKYDTQLKSRKYFEKFNDPYSSHSMIWNYLRSLPLKGAQVLELGVGDAAITRRLHEAGAIVDGVEIDDLFIGLARPYCRTVIKCDIDQLDQAGLAPEYDIVLAADVLEHLRRPDLVLATLKKYIRKDGKLIVSLPNIANLYVRLNLLLGRFPTHSKGLLDETHLHCYVLATMRRLIRKTGWVIERESVTIIPFLIIFPFLGRALFRWMIHVAHWCTRAMPGLLGYQGIFFCRNPNRPDLL